ncbi:type II secretion system protein [Halobacterium litoreum]|uniref:Type II secretion system protein n=1 Tax=Halobacterium litoreum TaxID=2039234 RepID=A0ABD5NH71_9EURY|nr:type II secretion system protein [Halobacterium litoreum]UHH12773.1 type II secretion system protein [Halobacterium litoreum]
MTDTEYARTALGVAAAGSLTAVLVADHYPYVGAAVGVLGVAAGVGIAYGPRVREVAERSRALGAAPDLVCLVVLSLRLEPALERASSFAAEQGDGRLADSLAAHTREARGRPAAGFDAFAATWAEHLPSLRRAAALADAAVDAAGGDRERLLDRTLAVVVEGARERTSEYADAVRGPTTAVYAFGVVLPLALVGVAPAAASAGVPLTVGAFALGYGVVLPLAVLAAACWVLARRPVAFPPAPIPDGHPELAGRRVKTAAAAGLGIAAAVAASWFLPAWALPVLAVGLPVGGALAQWFRPACEVREDARSLEAGLADALSVLGHRLRQGQAVEAAVTDAGDTLDGATGDAFADAARRMGRLRIGVEEAFLGDHGPLARVPSERARAAVALAVHAADAGPEGGRVLVDVAGLFDDLAALDRDVRREFADTTRTLRHTALVYAPLVAGVTVALSGRVGGLDGATALDPGALAVAVGGYVLWLAVLLPALAVGLERGLDRALVGYHAGVALAAASVVYPLTAVLAGRVL